MGISMVHQHFKLVPGFTVAQNVFLGMEPKRGMFYDAQEAIQKTEKLSETYGLEVDARAITRELSVGLQQRVEILKALRTGAEVLILDEPTAVLTPQETEELFKVIRRIVREMNLTVILITHKLPEVMAISDRVGVMRRGKLVKELRTAETSEREIASLMVGRDVIFDDLRSNRKAGREVLCIRNLHALSDRGLPALRGINITVHKGEIVGICGVEGNGQSELAECISGMRVPTDGKIELRGRSIIGFAPAQIREAGLSYIPEDRMSVGLDGKASIMENLLVGRQRSDEFSAFGLHLRKAAIREHAEALSEAYDIRHSGVDSPVSDLSGGNMQKVVIAREFDFDSPVLLVCQPTRGVDIGATEFIHESIIEKRNEGCGVLLISADLDELFRLSDRLVCVFEGMVTGEFETGEISREEIGYYMTGGSKDVGYEMLRKAAETAGVEDFSDYSDWQTYIDPKHKPANASEPAMEKQIKDGIAEEHMGLQAASEKPEPRKEEMDQ